MLTADLALIVANARALVAPMSQSSSPPKSLRDWLHAGFRAIDRAWFRGRSTVRLAWARLLYPGLSIGRNVLVGPGVRFRVLNNATLRVGDGARIEARVELHSDGMLTIGTDAFIGPGSIIVAAERVDIGHDALIAAHVTIRDQDHRSEPGTPYRLQGLESAPVRIGDNVWLGAGVVVVRGVSIGDHCVVGANSVVTRSLPPGTRAVGAPARPITDR
ncbi:MAG TPA: acyltransferase [Sphingomicrobium sp.]|nr:acyltransferase [Sphingomicrobium sp.]